MSLLITSNTLRKTRTSIYTPGDPPLMPDDLSQSMLLSAFDEARLVYFDGMSTETALFVAQEVIIISLLVAPPFMDNLLRYASW